MKTKRNTRGKNGGRISLKSVKDNLMILRGNKRFDQGGREWSDWWKRGVDLLKAV